MPQVSEDPKERLFMGIVGSVIAGMTIWLVQSSLGFRTLALEDLVDPEAVSDIAAMFSTEDEFINKAWAWVRDNVDYQGFGSELTFLEAEEAILCRACHEPAVVVQQGQSNCVGQSVLLASLLRNRLPPERVFVAVGLLVRGNIGGHAWVTVQRRDGTWYVLEATRGPGPDWVPESAMANIYVPEAYFNDKTISCFTPGLCVSIQPGCNCDLGVDNHAVEAIG